MFLLAVSSHSHTLELLLCYCASSVLAKTVWGKVVWQTIISSKHKRMQLKEITRSQREPISCHLIHTASCSYGELKQLPSSQDSWWQSWWLSRAKILLLSISRLMSLVTSNLDTKHQAEAMSTDFSTWKVPEIIVTTYSYRITWCIQSVGCKLANWILWLGVWWRLWQPRYLVCWLKYDISSVYGYVSQVDVVATCDVLLILETSYAGGSIPPPNNKKNKYELMVAEINMPKVRQLLHNM